MTKDYASGLIGGRLNESAAWGNSQGILYLAPTGSNTYQGNTTINSGTILLGSPYALPSTTVLSIDGSNGSTLDLGGQSVAVAGLYNGTLTNSGGTITNSGGSLATLTITGNGLFSGTLRDGNSQTALKIASTGVVTLGGTNTNTGGMTVNAGTLQLASASAAQSNTVTLNVNHGLTFNTANGTITTFNVAGLGGSGNVVLADSGGQYNVTLNVGGNGALSVYNGQLSGGGGLTKSGNGTLTLDVSSSMSYSGNTTVSGGVLNINGALATSGTTFVNGGLLNINGVITASGPTNVNSGGTLNVNTTDSTSPVTVNNGGVLGGNGIVSSVTVTGGGAVQAGSVSIGALTFNSSASNPGLIDVSVPNYGNWPVLDVTASNGLTASGGTGSVAFALSGPAGPNRQHGAAAVRRVDPELASGVKAFTVNTTGLIGAYARASFLFSTSGGVLDLSWSGAGDYPIWRGNSNGSWDTTTANWVRNTDGAPTTYIDATGNSAGDAVLFDDTAGTGVTTISITASNVSPGSVTFGNTNLIYTVNGPGGIVGSTALSVTGGGLVTLANSNGYTGATLISAGTLQAAHANALTNSTVTVNDTLIFNTNGGTISNFNLGGLAGGYNGNVILTDTGGYAANLTVGSNGASTVFSGQMSGSGGVTKVGAGNLTLGGNDSYSGSTTITGGTLTLANQNAASNSTVTVNVNNGLAFSANSTFNVVRWLAAAM